MPKMPFKLGSCYSLWANDMPGETPDDFALTLPGHMRDGDVAACIHAGLLEMSRQQASSEARQRANGLATTAAGQFLDLWAKERSITPKQVGENDHDYRLRIISDPIDLSYNSVKELIDNLLSQLNENFVCELWDCVPDGPYFGRDTYFNRPSQDHTSNVRYWDDDERAFAVMVPEDVITADFNNFADVDAYLDCDTFSGSENGNVTWQTIIDELSARHRYHSAGYRFRMHTSTLLNV